MRKHKADSKAETSRAGKARKIESRKDQAAKASTTITSEHQVANDDYTVGWICAITTEYVAAQVFLDEEHGKPENIPDQDNNNYTLGKIGKHNVVIAVMPLGEYGITSAVNVARDMLHAFPNVRIGLMVGIAGGAPSPKHDIRLGDVVVSTVRDGHGGVFQYDFGKKIQDQDFQPTGYLNQTPTVLRAALGGLIAQYEKNGHQLEESINSALNKNKRLRKRYSRPESSTDRLYQSEVTHPKGNEADCVITCGNRGSDLIFRPIRSNDEDNPAIHYGLIASGNQLMKDATARDKLADEKNVLCFEMEAAGLMNHFPCLVIRGICDYSDTHKNKDWQGYAAMVASAYAKDLLRQISPKKIEVEKRLTELMANVDKKLEAVGSLAADMKTKVEHLQADNYLDKIEAWLSPVDASVNLNRALDLRHAGSGQWLLQSKQYRAWKEGFNTCLWLYGIPGCGKTILSTTVIEDLKKSKDSSDILYFYFDFSDENKQTLGNMVRSLISQLYNRREDVREHLNSVYTTHESGKRQPSTESLSKTFQAMIQQTGYAWIVLDALDECRTQQKSSSKGLLSWISNLRNSHSSQENIHILVTSRPEQDIKSAIENWSCTCSISLQDSLIRSDINGYIKEQVKNSDRLVRWRSKPEIQAEIENILMEKANGMFRWVTCQLDALEACLEPRTLRKELESLPEDLNKTYTQILERIPNQNRRHTIRILQFLTFSERPLRLEEAVDVITVDIENKPYFDPNNRMPIHEEILRFCSSLVTIRLGENGIPELQLAHLSVKEYLGSNSVEEDFRQSLKEDIARTSIAEVCVAYLLGLVPMLSLWQLEQHYPMAGYAAQYWSTHAAKSGIHKGYGEALISELFTSPVSFQTSYSLYQPDLFPWGEYTGEPQALYYASFTGLTYFVKKLIDRGADVNAQGGNYSNALQAASSQGHLEIVQTLLDSGADVNTQGGAYGNSLQAALADDHLEIFQILLDRGANVNAQGGQYGNALRTASIRGHLNIVQLLLDRGADINAQGVIYGNALQAASEGGHLEIVQMLLDGGAGVNAQGGVYGNALYIASERGHLKIIQTLLDRGADVNAQGGVYGNALQVASAQGHLKIVQTLLYNGADVNAQGGVYGNALQAALERGHLEIVQTLLDEGADFNAQGGEYGSALQTTSTRGHLEIVQMLLNRGAGVNAQGGVYGNALQAASAQGHLKIIQTLLDRGADVNAQGGVYGNALQAASAQGHTKIIQTLLGRGADVNAQGGEYGSALQTASTRGHLEIIQILLNRGADVNARGGAYGNALQAALMRGHLKIVQTLLDGGANVNAQDGIYGNALQAASIGGHIEIVQTLLNRGANANTQGGVYGNALQAASAQGHLEIVQMLLDRGADVSAQGGMYGNALQAASEGGHLEIVKMLLDRGADISAQGGVYGNALQAASIRGHLEIVQILLDRGADVNAQGGVYGNALQAASEQGHLEIFQMLLDGGSQR